MLASGLFCDVFDVREVSETINPDFRMLAVRMSMGRRRNACYLSGSVNKNFNGAQANFRVSGITFCDDSATHSFYTL
jgi:hypothetical protein